MPDLHVIFDDCNLMREWCFIPTESAQPRNHMEAHQTLFGFCRCGLGMRLSLKVLYIITQYDSTPSIASDIITTTVYWLKWVNFYHGKNYDVSLTNWNRQAHKKLFRKQSLVAQRGMSSSAAHCLVLTMDSQSIHVE